MVDDEHDYYGDWIYADPAIKAAYRDALSRLILAYNEADLWMTVLLDVADDPELFPSSADRLKLPDFRAPLVRCTSGSRAGRDRHSSRSEVPGRLRERL